MIRVLKNVAIVSQNVFKQLTRTVNRLCRKYLAHLSYREAISYCPVRDRPNSHNRLSNMSWAMFADVDLSVDRAAETVLNKLDVRIFL